MLVSGEEVRDPSGRSAQRTEAHVLHGLSRALTPPPAAAEQQPPPVHEPAARPQAGPPPRGERRYCRRDLNSSLFFEYCTLHDIAKSSTFLGSFFWTEERLYI